MKTLAYMTVLTAATVAGAHAQTAYEVRSTSSTEMLGDMTKTIQTNYVSTTSMMPAAIGDAPATPVETSDNSVKVKLPGGEMISVADSAEAPWNKDARLSGYDRFTFDAESGAFVAGKGDEKFANNWDENGNRIVKKAPAPKKKKVVAEEAAAEATAAEAPAMETPAAETAVETPAEMPTETPAAVPAQ